MEESVGLDHEWVVPNPLLVGRDFLHILIVPCLGVFGSGGIHIVTATDQLLHSKGEDKKGMLTSMTIHRNTSFKTTRGGIDDKNDTFSL